MRRIFSIILSIAMVMSCFGVTAFAADEVNTLPGINTNASGSYADACYTPDPTIWTKADAEIQPSKANDTYVGKDKYYTTGNIGGAGDDVTAVLMTNASAADTKCVFSMNTEAVFKNRTDLLDTDRIHYSAYFNVIEGTVAAANILPANAGGINISQNLLYNKKNFGVGNNRWVKFDVFYQPTITYTYTKKDAEGNETTGTWKSNMLQQARNSNDVASGVDFSKMPGYDSTCTYTSTKSTHGLTSAYINGEPVFQNMTFDSTYVGTRDWDNLPSRMALHGAGAVVAFAKGKVELIRNFDESAYDFADVPVLASADKYTVSGSTLIYNQPITAADIAAPAGCEVVAYSDAALTKENKSTLKLGDTIVVRNGADISYYVASDGKNIITTTMSSIVRSTHSEYTSPLAGKAAPFTKITKSTANEDNAYFEVNFGSRYPSIDTEKYYVLEMNYLPESNGAYVYFGGQQSSGLGVENLTLTNGTLVQNQWNKIVVVLENGSTEANPYPANKKDYASAADAKAASPHTLSLYCNGKLVTDKAKTQLGMIWNNNGRQENFFRIQVLPKNTTAETYAYVDDVVFYGTDKFTAADAALPSFDMTSIGGSYTNAGKLLLAANVEDINAIDGLEVLGKTEGIVEGGDVIAYTDGKDVAYYPVAGSNKIADRDGNPNSIGWEVDGTTLRIYDIPEVGTGRMPSGQGANNTAIFPWVGLTGITDVVIEDGIQHIGSWTIFGMKGIKTVTIPASVVAMDAYAFNSSVDIDTVIFEEGSTGFGSCVINRDSSIKNLYLPSTATKIDKNFWRGLDATTGEMAYVATNKTVNIYAPADSAAYTYATTVQANKPADVTVNVSTEYSDRLYTFVRNSYLGGMTVSNGAGKLGVGASGKSYDTAFETYSTTEGQNNMFISGASVDKDLFAKRKYAVLEADVKFTENTREFFFASNQHKNISPYIRPESPILKDGWNKITTVVEYATGVSKTYINGILHSEIASSIGAESADTATRFVAYNNENGLSETVPVLYIDNMAIYLTDVNPAGDFEAPVTATAFDAENGVTFTVSEGVKALDSNVVIAVAYDADNNMLGKVVMASDSATIAPVAGAVKYVGYVWNSIDGLAPIAASVTVPVQ